MSCPDSVILSGSDSVFFGRSALHSPARKGAKVLLLLADRPAFEVGLGDVAAADDRHDPFAAIAGSILQDRGDAEGGGRLDDEAGVPIEQAHAGLDAVFLDQG